MMRLGRYTLVRALGAGGMAELYLARADGIEGFSMLCAVKRILAHKAQNEKFVRMFLNEARLVAALNHPNIAHVHDIGREGGEYYFAMEYVHGQDLRHIFHAAPGHLVRLENALHIAIGVCAGLHHAHEAVDGTGKSLGIVHRDVSPSNVLVSYQGSVKLVDFGIAKAASVISDTREGVVKGKYGYMSPEQCLGESVDRRSDVFSVGIILWELTVGRRLYKSNGELQALQRVVYADAPRPSRFISDYPPDLEQIAMRALSRDPSTRYQTAEALQIDLESFAREHKLSVSPLGMAAEMKELFRERLDAWREAEQAGRSLADHLAEARSESSLPSEHDDDIDGVINQLQTGVYRDGAAPDPVTRAESAAAKAGPRAADAPVPPPVIVQLPPSAPVRRRSRVLPVLVIGAVLGVFAAGFMLMGRGTRGRSVDDNAAAASADAQDQAGSSGVVKLDVVAVAVDPEPTTAVESEPADATPTPTAEVASEDAGRRATTHREHERSTPKRDPKRETNRRAQQTEETSGSAAPPTEAPAITSPSPPPPPPPPPRTDAGPSPGTIDATQVRAVVRAHLGEIRVCVDRARMDDRDLSGRIVLRIDVDGKGHVTRTSVSSSRGANAGLESCMMKAVSGWMFPAPAGGVRGAFTYPFAF